MVPPEVVHNRDRDRDSLHFIFLQTTTTSCHNNFVEIQGNIMLIIKILFTHKDFELRGIKGFLAVQSVL